ncbi:hypothetical protein ACFXHA_10535 [Nocardia sp. NPDC059240]|uniref:hypothetical protein n=1 Tax=Nocardia sp. NPDC059240 TaxID=3346786 RepID=UPI0036AF7122
MTTADPADVGALQVLADILMRYDSLDDFLRQLHRELDTPTQELPRVDIPAAATGGPRHALTTHSRQFREAFDGRIVGEP